MEKQSDINKLSDTLPPRASIRGGSAHQTETIDPFAESTVEKPTLKTVAQATGFAVTTVSRALKGDPKIARSTRAAVEAAAARLGYVPDRAAQRLRTGRTNVIALVLDPHEEILGFAGSMIAGLASALEGTRYHISIMQHAIDADAFGPIERIVRNRLADGVVFARTRHDDPRVRFLQERGFAFVTHGRTEANGVHPWLDYDNNAFARLAVERLVARGRRRIGIVPPSPQFTFHRHMTDGFWAAVTAAGVAAEVPPEGIDLNSSPERVYRWFLDRVRAPDPPDGMICPGEIAAVAVQAAVADAGLAVGRDVELVAKQTSHVFDLYRPRLDTIYEDIEAAGQAIGGLLLRRIAGEDPAVLSHLHQPQVRF